MHTPQRAGHGAIRRGPLADTTLPTKLSRLLADKDAAHYSPNLVTIEKAKAMVRQARALLAEAEAL